MQTKRQTDGFRSPGNENTRDKPTTGSNRDIFNIPVSYGPCTCRLGGLVIPLEEIQGTLAYARVVAKALVEKGLVEGLELDKSSTIKSCDSCEYGKAHRKPIRKEREEPRASAVGEEIHTDVWGPSPVQTINGREYYATFTDDFNRYSHLYLLRTKDQVFDAYKNYEAEILTQRNARIQRLRSDRGGEYLSSLFTEHLAQAGTLRSLTVHDTPEYNGVSERLNRTLLERVRAMLHSAQLPKFLWGEAVKHAVYLKNRTSTKALEGVTPFEAYHGKKPNLAGLHEFGAKVWVHNATGSKLDGRSAIGRWVGFDESSNGHRIYWPERRTVSIERSVKFDTDAEVFLPHSAPLEGEEVTVSVPKRTDFERLTEQSAEQPIPGATLAPSFQDNPVIDHLGEHFEHPPPDQGRPKRIRTESAAIRRLRTGEGVASPFPSERAELPKGIQEGSEAAQMAELHSDWDIASNGDVASGMAAAMAEADALEPTYEEAQTRSDWPEWQKAILAELNSLKAASTWELVERPSDTPATGRVLQYIL